MSVDQAKFCFELLFMEVVSLVFNSITKTGAAALCINYEFYFDIEF